MKSSILSFCLSLLCALTTLTHAQTTPTLRLVPTLESCSVYVQDTQIAPADLKVQYRMAHQADWQTGHALVNSDNDAVPRTSLFYLTPDTSYQVRVLDKQSKPIASGTFNTWSETKPIAKTITLTAADFANGGLHLTDSGTEQGWLRYVGDGQTVLDAGLTTDSAIHVDNAQYIILENIILKGGNRHGIHLDHSSNIIVRNCDISGYSRVGTQRLDLDGKYFDANNKAINWDSGICINLSGQLLIEHNFIHDPRATANSWFYSHPAGPNAIFLRTRGQVVIRYNDLIGSTQHRWNDVIEGYGNGHFDGGANCDSDIYGNYLAFGNDDGIELDGGQCNVRFWGNKIEGTLCGISTASNMRGPSFIFRNLVTNLGDERSAVGSSVKNGGGTTHTHGISHFYHNTFYTRGNGIKAVGYGKDDNRSMFYGISRNNLFALGSNGIDDPHAPAVNDFDYDLFATLQNTPGSYNIARPMEAHGIIAPANLRNPMAGDFRPMTSSAANHAGVLIPGFTQPSEKEHPTIGIYDTNDLPISPIRPLSVYFDQPQLMMTVLATDTQSSTQKVAIHTERLTHSIAYTIQKNTAFDWLTVTPANGTLLPGKEASVNVSVDRSRLQAGLTPGAWILKLVDGRSLPMTVYVKYAPFSFDMTVKADACEGADSFALDQPGDDAPIDGDEQGLWFRTVKGREPGDRSLTVMVNIPREGDYFIHVKVKCPEPGGLHDSAYLQVNDEPVAKVGIRPGNFWHWVTISQQTQAFHLKAGANRIRLLPREPIWIDAIHVGTMPIMAGESFTP